MPVVSRVIVGSSEARVIEPVRFRFERAGAAVVALPAADAMAARLAGTIDAAQRAPDLVVAGADTVEDAEALLRALRQALGSQVRVV